MILSQAAKYGLRATVYLAQRTGQPQLSREIAAALGVPAQYLAKILQALARHGILRSAKGRGGGFRLAHPAAQLSLLQVVRAIEGEDFGEGCVLGLPHCSDANPCPFHGRWKGIRDSLLKTLRDTSLSDLMEQAEPDPSR